MNIRTRELKKFKFYDKTLSHIETPQGTLTLVSVFLPFLVEMLLTNSMGTVNTLVLSHYSDEAVASVGAANQLMGMIFTFYTVISTGASIFISHRLGARQKEEASDASKEEAAQPANPSEMTEEEMAQQAMEEGNFDPAASSF